MKSAKNNEEDDVGNLTRRISRPRVQYSPIPEINKKRLLTAKKTPLQFKQNLDLQRLNSTISSSTTLNDSSESTYSTRENSYFDESPFEGVDFMTQKELRAQLEQVDYRDFMLPAYFDLRQILEKEKSPNSEHPQSTDHSKCLINDLLDGQAEIKKDYDYRSYEPSKCLIDDSLLDEQAEINNDITHQNQTAREIKRPRRSTKLYHDYIYTTTSNKQKEKFQNSDHNKSTDHSKCLINDLLDEQVEIKKEEKSQDSDHQSTDKSKSIIDGSLLDEHAEVKNDMTQKRIAKEIKRSRRPTRLYNDYICTATLNKQKAKDIYKIRQKIKIKPTIHQNSKLTIHRGRGRPRKIKIDETPQNLTDYQQLHVLVEPHTSISIQQPESKITLKKKPYNKSGILHAQKQNLQNTLINKTKSFKRKFAETLRQEYNLQSEQIKKSTVSLPMKPTLPKVFEISIMPIEFFKRMTLRKQFNSFALGIRKLQHFIADYFYREILVDDNIDEKQQEEAIDCVKITENDCVNDELIIINPADEFASAIHKLFFRDFEDSIIDDSNEDPVLQKLNRIDFNADTNNYLDILLKFIIDQRHIDIVTHGITGGTSMFYSLTMKNANRLRESLKLYSKARQHAIITAHCWLLKHLNACLIASYLNLLRFLKIAGSNLADHIITFRNTEQVINDANLIIHDYLFQKIYEPPMNPNIKLVEEGPIPNVSLVLVYPQITTKTCKHFIRAHETLFRQLLPPVVCCVEKIDLNFEIDLSFSIEECAWLCINLIRKRVREIVKRRPNDHIFLAGWGTTCWLNHKVISNVSGVSGILNFAFPTESACGSRGTVDDQICLTYPSTLFVVGENAVNVSMNALNQLRKNMITDTGLIVVGDANHNLLVSQKRLCVERITQFAVQRTIVEYTLQFIKQVITDLGSPKECRSYLRPVKLPNIYEVDATFLKLKSSGVVQSRPRKLAEKNANAEQQSKQNVNAKTTRGLVTSESFTTSSYRSHQHRPTSMASNLPQHLQPVIPVNTTRVGALHTARTTFSNRLKGAIVGSGNTTTSTTTIKIPSPEMLNKQMPALLQSVNAMQMHSQPSTSLTVQDTLREEEEAAAALSILK